MPPNEESAYPKLAVQLQIARATHPNKKSASMLSSNLKFEISIWIPCILDNLEKGSEASFVPVVRVLVRMHP